MSTTTENKRHLRRASKVTELFVRATFSEVYKANRIRTSKIFVMIYLEDPNPNDKFMKDFFTKMLTFPRFSSRFLLRNNRVYHEKLPLEEIDYSYHVRSTDSKGTFDQTDLNQLITKASLEEWEDPNKPLWRCELVKNLKDGRSMIFCNFDHAIGDGTFLTTILRSMLNDSSSQSQGVATRRSGHVSVRMSRRILLFLYGCYYGLIGFNLERQDPNNGLKIPSNLTFSTKTSQSFTTTKFFELKEIKEIKSKMMDTTINDFLVGLLTIAMRLYYEKTKDPVLQKVDNGAKIKALAAVDLRKNVSMFNPEVNEGNNFMFANLTLPLSYRDAVDAVWKSKALMDDAKLSPALHIIDSILGFCNKYLPEIVLMKAAIINACKPTCSISNVRGPSKKCTIAGYLVDDLNFTTSSPIGVSFGFLSYNNRVHISCATHESVNVDCVLLQECVETAFDELKNAIMNREEETIKNPYTTRVSDRLLEIGVVVALISSLCALIYKVPGK